MEGLRKFRPSNQAQGEPSQGSKFAKRALVSEELGRGFPGMAGERKWPQGVDQPFPNL
jgi:hypothetical protein